MVRRRVPIVGGGAGTGLSAKCEEAGGIDLIIIYNSGRYRMAGRGSAAGLLAYGNANEIVKDMAREVLPVVKHTPVLAGVNGTDPFVLMPQFLAELKAIGFSGVQNFPTVGLFDGVMRRSFEETGMGYGLEVDMIRAARELDLLTTPYVFNPDEARAMAEAGADIIVAHMGVTTGGSIGATTATSLDDCVAAIDCDRRGGALGVDRDVIVLCHGGPIAMPDDADYVLKRCRDLPRLLRRIEHGAPAGRDRAHRADAEVQGDRVLTAGPGSDLPRPCADERREHLHAADRRQFGAQARSRSCRDRRRHRGRRRRRPSGARWPGKALGRVFHVLVAEPVGAAADRGLEPHLRRKQAGLDEEPIELCPDPHVRARRTGRRHHQLQQLRRRLGSGNVVGATPRSISLNATMPPGRTVPASCRMKAAGSGRYIRIHRPTAASKARLTVHRLDVAGLEGDIAVPSGVGPRSGRSEDLGIRVEADHSAGRADHVGKQHRHIAGAAADVEDGHAGLDPGRLEQPSRDRRVDSMLKDEALRLGVAMAKKIGVGGVRFHFLWSIEEGWDRGFTARADRLQ